MEKPEGLIPPLQVSDIVDERVRHRWYKGALINFWKADRKCLLSNPRSTP
jgi:hypothetical protein